MNLDRIPAALKNSRTWLYSAASALLILMAIAAFASPSGAWPLSVAAIVCIFLANIDKFSEVSATTSGVSATLREAKGKINDLNKLIEVMAEAQLFTIQANGRILNSNMIKKDYFLERILGIMRDAEISDDRIKKIRRDNWDYFVKYDYILSILGGNIIPHPMGNEYNSVRKEWNELRDFKNHPSPQKLRDFLLRVGEDDPKKLALLNAFEKYCEILDHPDKELWKSRDSVQHITIKNTALASP
ncbi:hypothetical protein AB4099_22075 [Bosea sp. 2KB_26]|uniref:hypothetical protein n=1 Tax=Bosea sp. 2KB_26 TaxID=3237475 RepID=UPI003F93086D